MKKLIKLLLLILLLTGGSNLSAQKFLSKDWMAKQKAKSQRKREEGRLMITPLAGPAYTPELEFTIAGGVMLSFKTDRKDSLIQRSSAPVMLGVSSTGAYFFGTKMTTFWWEDKLRVYADLNFKDMPDNYYGVGYEAGFNTVKGDSTTAYTRTWWQIYPRFLWQFKKHYFAGLVVDLNFTQGRDASPGVTEDPFYSEFNDKPFNVGIGPVFQYDARDIPVNAWTGWFFEAFMTFYGPYVGGQNEYQILSLDLRKYWPIKREGRTIAWQLKGRFGWGDVPYGEMSQPGTPFDLRGYTWGRYRDNSMTFTIAEYRHMFLKKNGNLSPHGFIVWGGVGSMGETVKSFDDLLPSFGFGYRLEVQPRMNLRIDIGFGKSTRGFYFNFNEAF